MLRTLFLLILLIAFGTLSVFFFYKFNEKREVQKDYYGPVPTQSVWVVEVRNPGELLATLKGTNIIYDELAQHHLWDHWRTPLERLDSLLGERNRNNDNRDLQNKLLFSLVPSGAGTYDILLSTPFPQFMTDGDFEDLSVQLLGNKIPSEKDYDGAKILSFGENGNAEYFLTRYSGYVLISTSEMVIEDGIRQLNSNHSLMADTNFRRIVETAGNSRKINWYIHQKQFAKYLAQHLGADFNDEFESGLGLPNWMELDLWLKPNNLMFNGYGILEKPKQNFFGQFRGQKSRPQNLSEILPLNTAFFLNYSFSNFSEFQKNSREFMRSRERLSRFDKRLKTLDDSAALNTAELIARTAGTNLALALLEIQSDVDDQEILTIKNQALCILRVKDPEGWIDDIVTLIEPNESKDLFHSKYRDIPIYEMSVKGLISRNIGGAFDWLDNRFFIVLDDYVIYGEREAILREVINAYLGGKVLNEDDNYQTFSENLSSNSHVTLYASLARSPYLLSYFLKRSNQDWIGEHLELFRKFEGAALQVTLEENDLLYYNAFVKHNPIYKKVTSSLWEIPVDSDVVTSPKLFINHYTKAGEILVQDEGNNLHLISNTGRVLWSVPLEGKVISTFHRVDKFKNNKYQILFNTARKVYLLDRNGKNVDGFPISLKTPASGPISVLDYDRNRKYRIMLPQNTGVITCFDINGKRVKGWSYSGKTPSSRPMMYAAIQGKDYLIVVDDKNQVRVVNRRGQDRLKIKSQLPSTALSSVKLITGKGLDDSYLIAADETGSVTRIYLNGKSESLQFQKFDTIPHFTFVDVNGDKIRDYVFQTPQNLLVYNSDGGKMLDLEPGCNLVEQPGIFKSYDKTYIALTDVSKESIYLYDHHGNLIEGSPFLGTAKPLLFDINLDGRIEFISSSSSGMIYCYVLN